MSLRDRLRRETNDQHEALEASTLFDELHGKGPRDPSYVAWLRTLSIVVSAIERLLRDATDPQVHGLWRADLARLPQLRADLVVLDDVDACPSAAVEPTLALVEQLRQWAREQPMRLVGALYVVEGSALGGRVLRERLLPEGTTEAAGLSYLASSAAETAATWKSFCHQLEALAPDEPTASQIVAGARDLFESLERIATALLPHEGDATVTVLALNTNAGDHHVTYDPRELVAAVDAGHQTWSEFPYFEARYGARGRGFTRSDSGWLVTLTYESDQVRHRHIDWLARLLARRGMPTLLLETHLRHLERELTAAVPERTPRYARLGEAGLRLRQQRLDAVPDFDALAATFTGDEVAGMGPVLVAAIADERNGQDGAVEHVRAWATDPQRFSPEWIASVHELLERADPS